MSKKLALESKSKVKRVREKKSLKKIPFYPGIWIKGVQKVLRKHIKDKRRYPLVDGKEMDKEDDIKAALRELSVLGLPKRPKEFPRPVETFNLELKKLVKEERLIKCLAEMNSNQQRAIEIGKRLFGTSRLHYWANEERKIDYSKRSIYDIIHGVPRLFPTKSDSPDLKHPVRYQEVRLP